MLDRISLEAHRLKPVDFDLANGIKPVNINNLYDHPFSCLYVFFSRGILSLQLPCNDEMTKGDRE
jgi:hypothetical protein